MAVVKGVCGVMQLTASGGNAKSVDYRYTPLCSFYTAGRLPHRSISGGKLYAVNRHTPFLCNLRL